MNARESALQTILADIASELRLALLQTVPSDDQIMVGHIRDSLIKAEAALSVGAERRWAA